LLKALGVPKNGLPVHIYRMREHGYPSGWLEEAREEYSGISIYTTPNECNYKCLLLYNRVTHQNFPVKISQSKYPHNNIQLHI